MEKAKEELRQRRVEFEPIRQKIGQMARGLAQKKLGPEEKKFVAAVMNYLPSGEPSLPQSAATTVLKYLEGEVTPEEIDMLLLKTLQRHRNAWSDVCTAFAALKVAVASER